MMVMMMMSMMVDDDDKDDDDRYSGVRGITALTGGRYLSVLISFDKLDI